QQRAAALPGAPPGRQVLPRGTGSQRPTGRQRPSRMVQPTRQHSRPPNKTRPFIAFNAELNGIVFNPGASAFTIMNVPGTSPTLTISGAGITNNSGIVQNFAFELAGAQILFLNSATAGSLTAFTTTNMTFGGTSTAGSATFINNGLVTFTNTATAGDSNFTNNSVLIFDGDSTASNGTFNNGTINTSGGFIQFGEVPSDAPTGGNGTFNNLGSASNTVGGGLVVLHFGT